MNKQYYITCAIPYANGLPHLGHAYEALAGDVLARWYRADGYDVRFLKGMDEHGQKVSKSAADRAISPQQAVDEVAETFLAMHKKLGISNDDFIRTTDRTRHWPTVEAMWQKMVDNGDIYLASYAGWYSVRDEAYCAEDETRMVNGKRVGPEGNEVIWMEEESYFFKLSAYTEKLLKFYEANPNFIRPSSRKNEIVSFVKTGLRDLSISRTSFDWGITVPNNPKHVMYVWVDALSNYISALGALTPNDDLYQRYWVQEGNPQPNRVHIIGKDISRFHCIFWPAFLMSANLPLPTAVHVHGFIYAADGQKMSKSQGNVIDPIAIAEQYGADQFRYYLMREIAYGQDGNFSFESFINRTNAELANDFGNLAQRSLSMIAKNCEGKVPEHGMLSTEDEAILKMARDAVGAVRQHMQNYDIHLAIGALWAVIGETNRYFAASEPWALKKTDPVRMGTVLWLTADIIRRCAILSQPFIPLGSAQILNQLAVSESERMIAHLENSLQTGTALSAPTGVFPRQELVAAA